MDDNDVVFIAELSGTITGPIPLVAVADALPPRPERMYYSGMTHATRRDGTPETVAGIPGPAPTGHETARLADILTYGDADEDRDLIHRLQPGVGTNRSYRHPRKRK